MQPIAARPGYEDTGLSGKVADLERGHIKSMRGYQRRSLHQRSFVFNMWFSLRAVEL